MAGKLWSDINNNFKTDASGAVRIEEDVNAVKTSITNILSTELGERLFLPEFGGTLRNILFEPMDEHSVQIMAMTIRDVINRWDDRIIIESIDFKPNPDYSYVAIIISFRVRAQLGVYTHQVIIGG